MSLVDLAVWQALRSTCRYRVGAVLVAGSRVLALSPNLRRNNPMVDVRHATFHTEEAVLRRVRAPAAGAQVYVARVGRSGVPLLARPCPRCRRALARAGVVRAHYTSGPATVDTMKIREPSHLRLQVGRKGREMGRF